LDFLVCFLGGARIRLFFLAPPVWKAEAGGAEEEGSVEGTGEGRDVPALPALGRGTRTGTVFTEGPDGPDEGTRAAPPDWNAPPIFLRNDPIFEIFIAAIAMAGPGAVSNPPVCGALAFLVVLVLFE
jgi:hypothetical protein